MSDYWLDSDSLITAKNGPYGFDIAPSFWTFIERKMNAGMISSSSFVYDEIADYVNRNFPQYQAADFLDGADPWLIAHAKAYGGKVVTFEVSAPSSTKPKIPDIAKVFDVVTLDIYRMIRELQIVL